MLPSKWKISDVSGFRHLSSDYPYSKVLTLTLELDHFVHRLKSCGSLTFCILVTDLRQFFMFPRNQYIKFVFFRGYKTALVDHEVPACHGKSRTNGAPNLVLTLYTQTMVICIFEELYKNEL